MSAQIITPARCCEDTKDLRKRSCEREACCASLIHPTGSCCDDGCIVEIAIRDCKQEHSSTASSVPGKADEEPCESHLARAKAAYGDLLINIGCICKTLLSLNLESCCTTETSKLRKAASWQSEGKVLLREKSRVSIERTSVLHGCRELCEKRDHTSLRNTSSTKPENVAIKLPVSSLVPQAGCTKSRLSYSMTNFQSGCCKPQIGQDSPIIDSHILVNTHAETPSNTEEDNCCNAPSCATTDGNLVHEAKTNCCDNTLDVASSTRRSVSSCNDRCCANSGRSDSANLQSSKPFVESKDHVSAIKETCGGVRKKCSDTFEREGISNCGDDFCVRQAKEPRSAAFDSTLIDVERGGALTEHAIISVQGMTCTGCETNLCKTLISIPGILNIKTSLVLARAEFDVSVTDRSSVADVVKYVERKTGFTCTLLDEAGYYLDLIVENAEGYSTKKDRPQGILAIEVLDDRTIRVGYLPEVIGARDLMRIPFFGPTALAPLCQPPLISSGRKQLWQMLFKTILSVVLTIPVLVMAWARLPPRDVAYGAVSLVLATIIQVYIAGPWYVSAFRALIYSRLIEVDFLVVLSSSTAYVYSIIAYGFLAAGMPLSTEGFFETSTLLVTLIMLGRLVTTFARQRAVESISVESLQSPSAILINEDTELQEEMDSRLLQFGDRFLVLPESSIVTDGTVLSGSSEVDESLITGESVPALKQAGSPVVAGSINHSGTLTVRLTRLTGNNTIKTIGLMVDEAKSSKARFQELADRVAGVFVPVILAITIVVFVVWAGVGKVTRGYSASQTCINAMTYAIAALIVSCPCAIGLAVPMVLVIAGGVAANHGVIFQSAETIEKARKITHVVFDKTGTLTRGDLTVVEEKFPNQDKSALMPMIYDLCSTSKHPVSSSIATHLGTNNTNATQFENIKSLPGYGIEAYWGDDHVRAGSPHWLSAEKLPVVNEILSKGLTVFCVTVNKGLVAVFGLQDSLQHDTKAVVSELQLRNIKISIISGDNEKAVAIVATQLDIPCSNTRARCSPGDKQNYIRSVSGKDSTVLFCGDGTNDAVALAEASIGMHINGGTDIAKSAADAVLIRSSLKGIIVLIDLSKAFYRRVVFNFVWSFVYNTFAILLAAGAFPNIRIEPQYAGLGEIVSVLPVIAVGLQLRLAKFTKM